MEFTDKQMGLINDLHDYVEKNGLPRHKDFTTKNGLSSIGYYRKCFNGLRLIDILDLAGVEISDDYRKSYNSKARQVTDDELLNALRDYSERVGFPTKRAITTKNGFPNIRTYYNRFGSLENAISLAGILIPEGRKKLYKRVSLSDTEIKTRIKNFTDDYIEKEGKLPIYEVIKQSKNLPSISTIIERFGSLNNLYGLLGYDLNYNSKALREKLIDEYLELAELIGRTPTIKDLDEYSLRGVCSSSSTYLYHFKRIRELQIELGLTPIDIGRDIADEELLEKLSNLSKKINRVPIYKDLTNANGVASANVYRKRFGSFSNTLKMIGFTEDEIDCKTLKTKNGTLCLSSYEYRFACLLESRKIEFIKDPLYKDFIDSFDENYRFDFVMKYNNKKYFVEIFGIVGNNEYDLRTKEKIKICKDNNIPLMSLYPDIFYSTTQDELFFYLQEKMTEMDEVYYRDEEGEISEQ